jgi:3-phenylpropionate/trans-cinnamate dioxygenase ferredoxin subunit
MQQKFEPVAEDGELAPGQMKRVTVRGRALLLVFAEGEYFAVDEMCSHEDYSLYYGCIKDRQIKCSLHGSYFDLATGAPRDEPATEPIRTYPVKVAEGKVWVTLAGHP